MDASETLVFSVFLASVLVHGHDDFHASAEANVGCPEKELLLFHLFLEVEEEASIWTDLGEWVRHSKAERSEEERPSPE